jgi:hypothetical protein
MMKGIVNVARRAKDLPVDVLAWAEEKNELLLGVLAIPMLAIMAIGTLAAVTVPLAIFWTAPTILWGGFMGVSPVDAFFYALGASDPQPQGASLLVTPDSFFIGFALFNILTWALIVAVVSAPVVYLKRRRRDARPSLS